MSQFGMQMPAGSYQRGPTMNVYTGLLFLAVMALLAACAFVFLQGQKIGPQGNAFGTHEKQGERYDIKFANEN